MAFPSLLDIHLFLSVHHQPGKPDGLEITSYIGDCICDGDCVSVYMYVDCRKLWK